MIKKDLFLKEQQANIKTTVCNKCIFYDLANNTKLKVSRLLWTGSYTYVHSTLAITFILPHTDDSGSYFCM